MKGVPCVHLLEDVMHGKTGSRLKRESRNLHLTRAPVESIVQTWQGKLNLPYPGKRAESACKAIT